MTAFHFPEYSRAERLVDGALHWVGVVAAPLGSLWLLTSAAVSLGASAVFALSIYALGLIGTLSASAAYNLWPPGSGKELLRRIDHAMIFVMIAGSYTPYALESLGGSSGWLLFAGVWSVAALGVALKFCFPRRLERLSTFLYLAMGWMGLAALDPLLSVISEPTLWLLAAGGIVYSLGTVVHHMTRLPFHNAIWHAMVLLAAGLHFAAASIEFVV